MVAKLSSSKESEGKSDVDVLQYSQAKDVRPRRVARHGYSRLKKILLVGEGDFSFALSLAQDFGSAKNLLATSLDTLDELLLKYKANAMENLLGLDQLGARVLHNVDATKMSGYSSINCFRYDTIVWNFPETDYYDIQTSALGSDGVVQCLLKAQMKSFFSNASKLMKYGGEVHVSHLTQGLYTKWQVQQLAQSNGLQLKEVVPFRHYEFPEYCPTGSDHEVLPTTMIPLGSAVTSKFVLYLERKFPLRMQIQMQIDPLLETLELRENSEVVAEINRVHKRGG